MPHTKKTTGSVADERNRSEKFHRHPGTCTNVDDVLLTAVSAQPPVTRGWKVPELHHTHRPSNSALDHVLALESNEYDAVQSYLGGRCGFGAPLPQDNNFNWQTDFLGDWNDTSNWSNISVGPNNPNHMAHFEDHANISGPTTVVTASAVTVNSVSFDSTHTFLVAGLGSVNLHSTTGPSPVDPTISVADGNNHQFQAVVNLQANGTVDIGSDSTLVMNNALNLNGFTLTKTGSGTLQINNDITENGGSIIGAGGMISGVGTIGGDLDNQGSTISPGNNASGGGQGQVPEPSTLILLGMGILAAACWRYGERT